MPSSRSQRSARLRHVGRTPSRPRFVWLLAAAVLLGLASCQPSGGAASGAGVQGLPAPPPWRYITDSPGHQFEAASIGFNVLDVTADPARVRALPPRTRALVWVGDYDNVSCSFQVSDDQLRQRLAALAGLWRVLGYYVSDEAHAGPCPTAPAQIAARTQLIHTLAPGKFTYQVLDTPSEFALFAHTTDVIGIDPYPCSWRYGCDFSRIPQWVTQARAAGIMRLWGVVQVFQDSWYRYPTPDELVTILRRWADARVSGEQFFSWTWAGNSLADRPGLRAVLTRFNSG